MDSIEFENNVLSFEELALNKKLLKYFMLLNFLAKDSFEKNQEWLIKFDKAITRDNFYQKKSMLF